MDQMLVPVANASQISVGGVSSGIGNAGCGSVDMEGSGGGGIGGGGGGGGAGGRDGVSVGDMTGDDFSDGGGGGGGSGGYRERIGPIWIFGGSARHSDRKKRGENQVLEASAILIVR